MQPKLVLASADQIREIAKRALDDILTDHSEEEALDGSWQDRRRRQLARFEGCKDALRFCCSAAMLLRDPTLIDVALSVLPIVERYRDEPLTAKSRMIEALAQLLEAGAPLSTAIRGFAHDDDPEVRRAVAMGLRGRDPDELKVLHQLLSDAREDVRAAAKASLGDRANVVWWRGKFDADPLERLSEQEAEACKDALNGLSELLEKPWWQQHERAQEIVALAEQLPDQLCIEVLSNVVLGSEPVHLAKHPSGPALLRRTGGFVALQRLLLKWSSNLNHSFFAARILSAWLEALPLGLRTSLCAQMLEMVRSAPPVPGERRILESHPLKIMAEALAYAWPTGTDMGPLLDVMLALPEDDSLALKSDLARVFSRTGLAFDAVLDRIIEAKLRAYPGAWRSLGYWCDGVLKALPAERLRPVAEAAARSEDDDLARWGWELLAGKLLEPARDGTAEEFMARLVSDERGLRLVIESTHLSELALDLLRERLRAESLDLGQAAAVISRIGDCYGGVVCVTSWFSSGHAATSKPAEVSHRIQGPPTEGEWRIYRRLREEAWAAGRERALNIAAETLPDGPWAPEDLPVLHRLVQDFRDGRKRGEVELACMLASKPSPDAPSLFDELLKTHNDSYLRSARRACMRAMGITADTVEDDEDDDWDDEDDDG